MKQMIFIRLLLICCSCFMLVQIAHAQELTIYTIPSPKPLHWASPKTLMLSFISNSFANNGFNGNEKHAIGHMIVELKDSSHYALVASSTDKKTGMNKNVLTGGYGLGVLFTTIKGRLEEEDKNLHQIEERSRIGELAFIAIKINQSEFNRLWQYLQEYKERGYDKMYNGYNKPREGLGAGCSAFAESFLEVGGLTNMFPLQEWAVQVTVPEELIGGPVAQNKYVQFKKLLSATEWAVPESQPSRNLFLYDPTKIYHWINEKTRSMADSKTVYVSRMGKAKGFIIDCTTVMPPQEPIWLSSK